MIQSKRVFLALLCASAACTSCGNLKPWVKPYERQNIADSVMSFSRDPASDAYLSHVYDAREGAKGADGGSGGGCGCN